jgi:hypothetical protein
MTRPFTSGQAAFVAHPTSPPENGERRCTA